MDLSSPTVQAMIGGVIRSILIFVGAGAVMTGDQVGIVAGALSALIGVGWSIYQKHAAAKKSISHDTLEVAVTQAAANPQNASAIIAAAKAGKF